MSTDTDTSTDVEIDLATGQTVDAQPQAGARADSKPEIEVVDDTPEQDRGRTPGEPPEEVTDDELSAYDEKVQRRIRKFTRGYHDERRAKEAALRERLAAEDLARRVLEENNRLKQQLTDGTKEFVAQATRLATADLDAAQRRYADAYEANDAPAMAKAQADIAAATYALQRSRETAPLQPQEPVVQPRTQTQKAVGDPKTDAWLRNNSWFGANGPATAYALAYDKELVNRGVAPGSDAYFSEIDKQMRAKFPEIFGRQDGEARDDPPPRTKPAAVVAPAARSTPPTRVRLTASEVAIANRLGLSLEDYAKQKVAYERGLQNG